MQDKIDDWDAQMFSDQMDFVKQLFRAVIRVGNGVTKDSTLPVILFIYILISLICFARRK